MEEPMMAEEHDRRIVDADREVQVQHRILTAMRMALALRSQRKASADEFIFTHGCAGIAEGAAIEIIQTLGLEPGYVNLKKPIWEVR